MKTYTFTEATVQEIVNTLLNLPARTSRLLLNSIEAVCLQEDANRARQTPTLREQAAERAGELS